MDNNSIPYGTRIQAAWRMHIAITLAGKRRPKEAAALKIQSNWRPKRESLSVPIHPPPLPVQPEPKESWIRSILVWICMVMCVGLFAFLWDVWIQYTIMRMKKPISEIAVSLCFKQASINWQIGLSEAWFWIREKYVPIAWDTWFWVHKQYCILRYDQEMVRAIFLHSWLWNYHVLNLTGSQYVSKDVTGSHDHISEKQHAGNRAWVVFDVILALVILCALLVFFVASSVLEKRKRLDSSNVPRRYQRGCRT